MRLRFKFRLLSVFLLAFSQVGSVVATEPMETHVGSMRMLPPDSLSVRQSLDSVAGYSIEASLEIEGMRTDADLGKTSWWIDWLDADSVPYMRVSLRWGNGFSSDPSFDSAFLQTSVTSLPDDKVIASKNLSKGVSLARGSNTLAADWDGSMLDILVGNDRLRQVCSLSDIRVPAMVSLHANEPVRLDYFASRFTPAPYLPSLRKATLDSLVRSFEDRTYGSGAPVGLWDFLDRDTDGIRSQIGGYYTVTVIPHGISEMPDVTPAWAKRNGIYGDPIYDIVYVNGAKVNAGEWEEGMLKGYLYATPFLNHYRLVWYDAMKEDMGDECFADIADNALMTLNFPLHGAKMRLAKRP